MAALTHNQNYKIQPSSEITKLQAGHLLASKLPTNTFGRLVKPIELFNSDLIVVPKFGAPKLAQSGAINAMAPGANIKQENRANLGNHACKLSQHH